MPIKHLTISDGSSIREIFDYCFWGDDPEWGDKEWKDYLEIINFGKSLGYIDNEKLVSCWVILDFNIFIRDVLFSLAGVGGVATFPQYRRQHIISQFAIESFKNLKENNQFVSVLYPFKYSFYRKYGYEICCEFKWILTKPSNILLPATFNPLKIRELSIEESFDKIKAVREKDGRKYNYILYSSIPMWRNHHFVIKGTKVHVIENESGEIVGYFTSHMQKEGEVIQLHIDEYNIVSEDAFLTMLDFVKKHTDQISTTRIPVHDEERIFDYFDELNEFAFKYKSVGGAMFRVVDIEQALSYLKFPKELSFTFSMKIKDDFAPWNSEPLTIQITQGKAIVSKSKSVQSKYDVTMDILAFNQLFVGYRSIGELIRVTKANVKQPIIGLIDKAFPKRKTYLSTSF